MNNQNETAQLRFLEETAIRLQQNGFTVGSTEWLEHLEISEK